MTSQTSSQTSRARSAILGLTAAALAATTAHASIVPMGQSYGLSGYAEVQHLEGIASADKFGVDLSPALAGAFLDIEDKQGVGVELGKKWTTWASSTASVRGSADSDSISGWGIAQVGTGNQGKATSAWATANAYLSYEFALKQPTEFTLSGLSWGVEGTKFAPAGGFASVNLWGEKGMIASLDWSNPVSGRLEPGVYRLDGSAWAEHDGSLKSEQYDDAGFEFTFHTATIVPTPGSVALAGLGAVLIAGRRRRTA